MIKSSTDRKSGCFGRLHELFRRLREDASGVTMIEFALVAAPFLALLFAIIEVALVYFGGFVLENAVDRASRMIRTGQVQQQGFDETQFKEQVCSRVTVMLDCENGLKLDVQRFDSFQNIGNDNFDPPLDADDNLDDSGFGYAPGSGGDIVLVRAYYVWDLFANLPSSIDGINFGLANMNGGRLLVATAAFRNEPFDG